MAFKEKGFQSAAAICVGVTAMAFGAPPAGLAEGSTAAAGLIGFVLDRRSRFGPECPRVLKKLRARVREGYDTLIRQGSKT